MSDQELEWTGEEGAGKCKKQFELPSLPSPSFCSPSFWPSLTPLEQIYFSSQASAAVRIKDDNYNFHHENTEPSLAEITTPTMHALRMYSLSIVIVLNQSSPVFLHLHLTLSGCSEGAAHALTR